MFDKEDDIFHMTELHLKLLNAMYTSWFDCEFGSPCIDPKRPYGNSGVYDDLAELMGIPKPDWEKDEDYTDAELKRMDDMHNSMEDALQIVLVVQKFEVGIYRKRCSYSDRSWEKIE